VPRPSTVLLILTLALVTAAGGSRALVASVGDAMVQRLVRVAAALQPPSAPRDVERVAEPMEVADSTPALAVERRPLSAPRAPRIEAHARRPDAKAIPGAAFEIPAERVGRLTEKQLRSLSAVDGVDAAGRAMGARLYGFSALGVGLADGDVVTKIDGRATPDVNSALAAAVHAYASGQDAARATVLRDGQPLFVTVRIPRKP
jgi:hypothetical protein